MNDTFNSINNKFRSNGKLRGKWWSLVFFDTVLLLFLLSFYFTSLAQSKGLIKPQEIDNYIKDQMRDGNIPGLSVVVYYEGHPFFSKEYGFSDITAKKKITDSTFFQLGGNSSAFTALGIYWLVKKGLLDLNDPATKYLPWFTVKINDGNREIAPVIQIKHLLHHTSGISFNTVEILEDGNEGASIEQKVKKLAGKQLENFPGEKFQYASINYDILGLIIEKVSGQPYAFFMSDNVMKPLGLHHTFLSMEESGGELATGYKHNFLGLKAFDAPVYKADIPANYIISNRRDMQRWMELQLGMVQDSAFTSIIKATHIPDNISNGNTHNTYYASGWFVTEGLRTLIDHDGNNPGFSSAIILDTTRKTGILVMANINSVYTRNIAEYILDSLSGTSIKGIQKDRNWIIDHFSFITLGVSIAFVICSLVFAFLFLKEIRIGRRKYVVNKDKHYFERFYGIILFLCGLGCCLYLIPGLLYNDLSWSYLNTWAPDSLKIALVSLYIAFIVFFIYFLLNNVYVKTLDNSLYTIVVLAILSGVGNAIIIYSINTALDSKISSLPVLLVFFLFGIFTYLFMRRLLSHKLVILTNTKMYLLKSELIEKILRLPFSRFERIPKENFLMILNGDTNEVCQFPATVAQITTKIVTLVCCFVYLGLVNFWGLIISVIIICVVCKLYYQISKSARRLLEESYSAQNNVLKFIDDMVRGFKELKLNIHKRYEFEKDFEKSNHDFLEKNVLIQMKFANVFILGELFFVSVFCVVVFVFPFLFKNIQISEIKTFVFVFLYMTGPLNAILNAFPSWTRFKMAWSRIDKFKSHFRPEDDQENVCFDIIENRPVDVLSFKDIEYTYMGATSNERFKIGPISCSFLPGEIVYITGGNGSGKSTLAKIITGLYAPEKGTITLNGEEIDNYILTQKFTAIFSDYHLFRKLYGIDYKKYDSLLQYKLDKLKLKEKLTVHDGIFNSLDLSTGQKKRLALLVSYLDGKSFYLFDEWAADQDPEFREYFYTNLLPELKAQKKIVIVISHDNKYFHLADRIYHLKVGKLVNEKAHIVE